MSGIAYGISGTDWQERINYPRMRQERLSKAQAAMKKHGIAACIVNRPDNIRYFTGVKGPEFAPALRYALGFAEHDPVVYELGDMLEHNRVHCTWIKPENWRFSYCWLGGIGGPESSWDAAKKWAATIADDLKKKGVLKEKVGVDGMDEFAARALAELGIATTPIMPAMMEARRTKTADEINCTKMASAICNAAFYTCAAYSRPGVRDCDVGAEGLRTLMRSGADYCNAGSRSGPNTFEMYHMSNMDRLIHLGDLQTVNLCGTGFMGMRTCLYRSFIVGREPNQKEKGFYEKCHDRVYSVIDEIKPGATTADAAKHFAKASDYHYEADERLLVAEVGHGVGLATYEQPVISRIFSFDHPMVFEPGMIIAVECREGEPGYGGVRLEENVVVTDTGHEVISTWPSDELKPIAVL